MFIKYCHFIFSKTEYSLTVRGGKMISLTNVFSQDTGWYFSPAMAIKMSLIKYH